MNLKKISSAIFAAGIAVFMANAESITFKVKDGEATLNIPSDLVPLVNQHKAQIEAALAKNGVTKSSLVTNYQKQINDFYDKYKSQFPSDTPFTDTVNGLTTFAMTL